VEVLMNDDFVDSVINLIPVHPLRSQFLLLPRYVSNVAKRSI